MLLGSNAAVAPPMAFSCASTRSRRRDRMVLSRWKHRRMLCMLQVKGSRPRVPSSTDSESASGSFSCAQGSQSAKISSVGHFG